MRRWLALLRFRQWVHFLLLPLAGVQLSMLGALSALRGMFIAAGVLAFGYLLNALWDRDYDLDASKNPFVARGVATRPAFRVAIALGAATLVLAAVTSRVALLAASVAMASGTLYSTGVRLKAIPFVGTLLNAMCFGPLLALGLSGPPPPGFSLLVVSFTALLLQNQLLHEATDADEDRGAGSRTTFLTVGPAAASFFALLLGAPVPIALWNAGGILARISAFPCLVVFVFLVPAILAVRGRRPNLMAKVRVAHRWASFTAGMLVFVAGRVSA